MGLVREAMGQDPCPEGGEFLSEGEFRAKGNLNKLAEKFPGGIAWVCSQYPHAETIVTHDVPPDLSANSS
ncbi:MAG TPA: hypothetical protein DD706_13185 [Nitrospiraceae bacterium]|nr:hypothetical protein [Nitrospiraceae bacterium]